MLSKAAERYSQAMIDLSLELRLSEKIREELQSFLHFLKKNEEIEKVLTKEIFTRRQKKKIIEEIAKEMGVSDLTKKFLIYLASQNRFGIFSDVYKSFHQKLNDIEGKSFAEISSAVDLAPALKSELQKKLEQLVGKKLGMTYKTDPALMGGVVTKIGNQIFDGSIKTQLQSLGQYLERGV